MIIPPAEGATGPPHITVHSCKFDGRIHRRWRARVACQAGPLVVLSARFEEEIRHALLGHIARGTLSTEYYWTDRWYNVFRFSAPDGALRNYYCNINMPARFDGRVLSYVDLDIDVLVAPDFSYQILDEDEFTANAVRFNYPAAISEPRPQPKAKIIKNGSIRGAASSIFHKRR